jgi:UDP:flavonoid glycosyltransferase YjiC (YdhE family)
MHAHHMTVFDTRRTFEDDSTMSRFLIVATAGAGGDLQPLVAAAIALRDRGHVVSFVGDTSVARALNSLDVSVEMLDPSLDLGPRLIGVVRNAMESSGGDARAAGPLVREGLTEWARDVAEPLRQRISSGTPDAVVTSLFGVEAVHLAQPSQPWAVVNSTFAVGIENGRPLHQDFAPRAIPLIEQYASLLSSATLVLHATDRVFDFDTALPANHHYIGPLGVWEPRSAVPSYLDEPGDPWVLVTISSQLQDDLALGDAALRSLAGLPVRSVLTVGPGHDPHEIADPPANARIEQTVSHSAVLERGALLVSHAGHGSVMKALWHGRPMVLVPWGRDQPGVAARAAALGTAVVVPREQADESTLRAAIEQVRGGPEFATRASEHGARLRATDPGTDAALALETLTIRPADEFG